MFDIVLDDGSLVPTVEVIGDRALGIIVGGCTLVFFLSRRCRRYIHAEFVARSGSHEFTVCRSSVAGFEDSGRPESGPHQNSPHGPKI